MSKRVPKTIKLILNETETIFLLNLPSYTAIKNTEEATITLEDNTLYEDLPNKYRKMVNSSTQTYIHLYKTRNTQSTSYDYTNNSTFASNWELYDIYNPSPPKDNPPVLQTVKELSRNQRYFEAVMVIERLLASNTYNNQQKRFKGLDLDNSEEEITFKYQLNYLWTFANEDTRGKPLTDISLNPSNEDIIAAAYGRYFNNNRKHSGAVMIWNIKNPKQPERMYFFQEPVTSLDFCNSAPNLLGVGFYTGHVRVLDITNRHLQLVFENSQAFEPAWKVKWVSKNNTDKLMVCFGDGRITLFDLLSKKEDILRVESCEGPLKGHKQLRIFEGSQSFSQRFASALYFTPIPNEERRYLLATSEGVVHKCAIDQPLKHQDLFKAHEGAIHTIRFSPLVPQVFATCGDDFYACLWMDGIDEPLVVSRYSMEPVADLDWSPTHSTVMVSVRGDDIFVWDFQRKVYAPQSRTRSPSQSYNTLCRFMKSGRGLLVGDVEGHLHVFVLEKMPFPAFFQKNAFFEALKKVLITDEARIKKINHYCSLHK